MFVSEEVSTSMMWDGADAAVAEGEYSALSYPFAKCLPGACFWRGDE